MGLASSSKGPGVQIDGCVRGEFNGFYRKDEGAQYPKFVNDVTRSELAFDKYGTFFGAHWRLNNFQTERMMLNETPARLAGSTYSTAIVPTEGWELYVTDPKYKYYQTEEGVQARNPGANFSVE